MEVSPINIDETDFITTTLMKRPTKIISWSTWTRNFCIFLLTDCLKCELY